MVTEVEYNKWVDKVIGLIKEVGPKINLPASSMQSPMIFEKDIDVVFLGHDAHETADRDWIFKLDEKYIRDRFKFGNHYGDHPWSGRASDSKWKIWNNLYEGFRKIGDTRILDNEERFIFTNAVFFTGDEIQEVNCISGNAVNACMELTRELIFDIIKPKLLVCLSIDDVLVPLSNNNERFNIKLGKFKPNGSKHNVMLAEYKGVRIAGIPHTSGAHGVLGSMTAIAEFLKNCMTMSTIEDIVELYKSIPNATVAQTINKNNDAKERRRENAKAVFEILLKSGSFCESPQGSGYKLQSRGLRNKTYGYEVYTNDVLPEAIQIFTEDEKLKKILVEENIFRELALNKYVLSSAELEKIGAKDFAEKIIPDIDNLLAN